MNNVIRAIQFHVLVGKHPLHTTNMNNIKIKKNV